MATVQRRKRAMVRDLLKIYEEHTAAGGADLLYVVARFVATRTVVGSRHGKGERGQLSPLTVESRGHRVSVNCPRGSPAARKIGASDEEACADIV